MKKAPSVSVLITAFNRLDFLPRTLDSVYAQTFADFDVAVFDDGSTDGTREWIAARHFPRLRCARSERNLGPAAARNAALAGASGEFAAFLDSDDLWDPDYLRTMIAALKSGTAAVACCDVAAIDARDRVTTPDFLRLTRDAVVRPLLGLPFIPIPSAAVVRRSAQAGTRWFDENFHRLHDDKDFFCRLARRRGRAAFHFIRRSLVFYRRHGVQVSAGEPAAHDEAQRKAALDEAYFHSKHRDWLRAEARRRNWNGDPADARTAYERARSRKMK